MLASPTWSGFSNSFYYCFRENRPLSRNNSFRLLDFHRFGFHRFDFHRFNFHRVAAIAIGGRGGGSSACGAWPDAKNRAIARGLRWRLRVVSVGVRRRFAR